MCGWRALELKWEPDTSDPPARCPECRTWLTSDGHCRQCADRSQTDLGYALMVDGWRHRSVSSLQLEGLSIRPEPRLSSRRENAVTGWKTLGATA